MSKKIKVDQLTKEIEQALADFAGTTEEACEKGVLETANDAVQALRNAHPPGSGSYDSWDDYNSGWTKRKSRQKTKLKGIQAIIWNEKHYRLTHLLEKGHAKVNGGRTRAFPHIAPVEDKCADGLVQNIRKYI